VYSATDILKRRKDARIAFACLYSALDEVITSEHLDDRDDSKILADLELLREKADDLPTLEH
jgi:hypothetical protein